MSLYMWFFCIPHSERWEFKHSMNKHVKYEKELASFAKTYTPSQDDFKIWGNMSVKFFLEEAHKLYRKEKVMRMICNMHTLHVEV